MQYKIEVSTLIANNQLGASGSYVSFPVIVRSWII
jgi:hypothetical protein